MSTTHGSDRRDQRTYGHLINLEIEANIVEGMLHELRDGETPGGVPGTILDSIEDVDSDRFGEATVLVDLDTDNETAKYRHCLISGDVDRASVDADIVATIPTDHRARDELETRLHSLWTGIRERIRQERPNDPDEVRSGSSIVY